VTRLGVCALLASSGYVFGQQRVTAIPLPTHIVTGSGSLSIDHGVEVVFEGYREPRLERAGDRFLARLAGEAGILPVPTAKGALARLVIKALGPSAAVQQLGEDESYHLEVATSGAVLSAANPLGILRGLQTFLQLVELTPQGFAVPAVSIDDAPRFPWRGLMIDSGRHFMPLSIIRQTLDGMEAVKMNVLHWHLSEDQGFRVESKEFPLLTQKGSDGLYYTQDEVRGVVEYARDRGIRVVPEFDMPGHSTAWFVGYPELASGKGPYAIEREWGVFNPAMDPTRESTYAFLDRFIGEMAGLFPDAYFHIGGDECNGKEWDANPLIQKYMHEHGLKDNAALQAYFTGRVQKLVTKRGKITVGWDEVLQPDTPKDVVIQSWRGQKSLAEAARGGYRGMLSAGYYIDLNEPASQHYGVDPMEGETSGLTAAEQKNILGGEATMWSEFVTPENVEGRIWPRTAAIAERLWSPQSVKDVGFMYERLAIFSARMADYGVDYRAAGERMVKRLGIESPSMAVLASVVEPPKEYSREELAKYYSFTPLNRLVDAVPPESDRAREFRDLAGRIAAGKGSAEDFVTARKWLILWRDNDALLAPSLPASGLTAELVPVSRNLSQAAGIGILALDSLEKQEPVAAATKAEWAASLKGFEAPQAVLLNGVVPGVEALVGAVK
jgi:hexosaminidase